jgi:hypothetical protein
LTVSPETKQNKQTNKQRKKNKKNQKPTNKQIKKQTKTDKNNSILGSREPPAMGKQLVNFITCDCESSAPFL